MKNFILISVVWMIIQSTQAQDFNNVIPLILVEGMSERKITPDEAIFSIRLEEKSMRVNDAVNTLNLKTTSLSDALRKAKIQNYTLIADNYAVDIHRVYRNGYSKDSGYTASQNLRIVTASKNEDLQKIVESIQNSGDMSFNLVFQISQKTKKSIEDELLVEALRDAKSKAELIAQTLGIKDIRVHKVNLNTEQPNFQNTMMLRSEVQESDMLISPDQKTLQKKISVNFTY